VLNVPDDPQAPPRLPEPATATTPTLEYVNVDAALLLLPRAVAAV
jgi:hypothetical protein